VDAVKVDEKNRGLLLLPIVGTLADVDCVVKTKFGRLVVGNGGIDKDIILV
jgi:hypothetical protein